MRTTLLAFALAGTTALGVGGVVAAQSQIPQPHGEHGMMGGVMGGMGNMDQMDGMGMMQHCPMMPGMMPGMMPSDTGASHRMPRPDSMSAQRR